MSSNRKGQATAFIVVGIFVLIFVTLFLFSRQATVNQQTETVQKTSVPDLAKPINIYVESCIQDLTKEAFQKIGEHGGYVDPTDKAYTKTQLKFNEYNPTESDGVVFSEPIVYWDYMKTPNTCTDCEISEENIPTYAEIEAQSNVYINRTLDKCLADFKDFTNQDYKIEMQKDRIVKTTIQDNGITVQVSQTISITKGSQTAELKQFSTELPLNFKRVYTIARNITRFQSDVYFLEGINMWLIDSYGRKDGQIPPPMAFDDKFTYKIWVKQDVQENVNSLLSSYVPYIQIAGTKGAKNMQYDSDTGAFEKAFYKNTYLDILDRSAPDTSVNFLYLDWPTYFNVHPSRGSIIMPEVQRFNPGLGSPATQMNSYEFYYDVSYPSVVMIKDDSTTAFKDGYIFMFGLESNVRCNRNLRDWSDPNKTILCPWPTEAIRVKIKTGVDVVGEINSTMETKSATANSLICDPRQKLSGKYTLETTDAWQNKPLDGVLVTFVCGNFASCPYDTTKINSDGNAVFTDNFPICKGSGFVLLQKDGYEQKAIELSTSIGSTRNLGTISLEPKKTLSAEVRIVPNADLGALKTSGRKFNEYEKVIIMISNVKRFPYQEDVTGALVFSVNQPPQNITLSSGAYDIDATLITSKPFTIPAKCKCEKIFLSDVCYPDQDMRIDGYVPGGGSVKNVQIKIERTSNKIIFYVPAVEIPDRICVDDMNKLTDAVSSFTSGKYDSLLTPEVTS